MSEPFWGGPTTFYKEASDLINFEKHVDFDVDLFQFYDQKKSSAVLACWQGSLGKQIWIF
jgi:hypothetical protein